MKVTMKENKDIVLQEICKLVSDVGYRIFYKWGESPKAMSWVTEERLHLWVQPKDGDDRVLLFDVAIGSSYLRVSFAEVNRGDCDCKNCRDRHEMLDFIKDCLLTR